MEAAIRHRLSAGAKLRLVVGDISPPSSGDESRPTASGKSKGEEMIVKLRRRSREKVCEITEVIEGDRAVDSPAAKKRGGKGGSKRSSKKRTRPDDSAGADDGSAPKRLRLTTPRTPPGGHSPAGTGLVRVVATQVDGDRARRVAEAS